MFNFIMSVSLYMKQATAIGFVLLFAIAIAFVNSYSVTEGARPRKKVATNMFQGGKQKMNKAVIKNS
jgi:hypothetical protein